MFDVRSVVLKAGDTLDSYLMKRATGISTCWDSERPFYLDVHDLPLDARTSSGSQPISFLVDYFRSRGARVVPVTGTEEDRGSEYLQTIRALTSQDGDGCCLRLMPDDLGDASRLISSISFVLETVRLSPNDVDVLIDLRYVGRDSTEALRANMLESLQVINSISRFRNIVVSGSSVPDVLGRRDQGKVRREPRIELRLWESLLETADEVPLPFSDYGIIGAHYSPPGRVVNVPARIRYTTARDHVFRRAKRGEHRQLCRQLIESDEFVGAAFSAGDQRLYFSSMGHGGPGTPAHWVGYDTNHHLELVSEQVWNQLRAKALDDRFALPRVIAKPWLQPELLDV